MGRGAAQLSHQRPFCLFAIPAQEDADAEGLLLSLDSIKIFFLNELYMYMYM